MIKIGIIKAQKKLKKINEILKLKTNNSMIVEFDYYNNFSDNVPLFWGKPTYLERSNIAILALKLNSEYVSTIIFDVFQNHITISSKTHDLYINRKFNLLLRTIMVYICTSIQIIISDKYFNTNKIYSYIFNPISELTLIKHFNAKVSKKDKDILIIICDRNQINKSFEKFNQIVNSYK